MSYTDLIPSNLFAEVQRRLSNLAKQEDVRILLAVESGSRAWGFPSVDSDLDCRFMYARPQHRYLEILPHRDVIELPLDGLFDINGWDIGKALRLLLKSNAVVSEWLESPIVYCSEPDVVSGLRELADAVLTPDRLRFHYLGLAERQWSTSIAERTAVVRKKYLYALRPALALRHLRMHATRPPMAMEALLDATSIPVRARELIDAFITEKRAGRELGRSAPVPEFDTLITGEIAAARALAEQGPRPINQREIDAANRLFQKIVGKTLESQ
jgi:predicted nucleotidyltransferase